MSDSGARPSIECFNKFNIAKLERLNDLVGRCMLL
jgi:hypothetical protein